MRPPCLIESEANRTNIQDGCVTLLCAVVYERFKIQQVSEVRGILPKEAKRRAEWIVRIRRDPGPNFEVSSNCLASRSNNFCFCL